MASTVLRRINVYVRLLNGTDTQGNDKFVTVTLGNLSEENYDADKVMAVVTALAPCLSKSISTVEEVKLSGIYAH